MKRKTIKNVVAVVVVVEGKQLKCGGGGGGGKKNNRNVVVVVVVVDLYCSKLQRPFILPRRGSFGVIHNGSLRIHKC